MGARSAVRASVGTDHVFTANGFSRVGVALNAKECMFHNDFHQKGVVFIRAAVRMLVGSPALQRGLRSLLRICRVCDAAAISSIKMIETCEGVHK